MAWHKVFDSFEAAAEVIKDRTAILLLLNDQPVCIARYGNELFATSDYCPHNKERLHNGVVNHLGEIICPWHQYRYDLTDGRECQARTSDLATYPVKSDENGVYLKL